MTSTLTIFGDIHGNLPALEAVFQDIEARGLTNLYCLGDLVGYGTFPNEVAASIRQRNVPTLMGSYDQGVGSSSDDCGCAYKTDIERWRGERGYAVVREEFEPELVGVSASVRDFRGMIAAALNVSGPKFRFGDHLEAAGELTRAAADHLSAQLGYTERSSTST